MKKDGMMMSGEGDFSNMPQGVTFKPWGKSDYMPLEQERKDLYSAVEEQMSRSAKDLKKNKSTMKY